MVFAAPVDSETLNPLSMSIIFMWCGWEGSPRKFDPGDDPHDPTCPRVCFSSQQWRWSLASQDACQFPAQCQVLIVEVFPAEGVGKSNDCVIRGSHRSRDRGLFVGLSFGVVPLLPPSETLREPSADQSLSNTIDVSLWLSLSRTKTTILFSVMAS